MDLSFANLGAFSDMNNLSTALAAYAGTFPGVNFGGADAPGTTYYGSQSAAQAAAASGGGSVTIQDNTGVINSVSAASPSDMLAALGGSISNNFGMPAFQIPGGQTGTLGSGINAYPAVSTNQVGSWTSTGPSGATAQDPGYANPAMAGSVPQAIITGANTQAKDATAAAQNVSTTTATDTTSLFGFLTDTFLKAGVVVLGVVVLGLGLGLFNKRSAIGGTVQTVGRGVSKAAAAI